MWCVFLNTFQALCRRKRIVSTHIHFLWEWQCHLVWMSAVMVSFTGHECQRTLLFSPSLDFSLSPSLLCFSWPLALSFKIFFSLSPYNFMSLLSIVSGFLHPISFFLGWRGSWTLFILLKLSFPQIMFQKRTLMHIHTCRCTHCQLKVI